MQGIAVPAAVKIHRNNPFRKCESSVQNPDIDMTSLSISSNITFVTLSLSFPTKTNRKKCPRATFWWQEAGVGIVV